MPKGNTWLPSEIAFLVDNAEKLTVKEIEVQLENRSAKAIRRMIEKLRERGELSGYKYNVTKRKKKSNEDPVWGKSEWD